MSHVKINPRTAVLLLFIVVTGAFRVLLHFGHGLTPLASLSPLGALALFGGAYFGRTGKALSLPLLTLFLSDVVLQQTLFSEYSSGLLYPGWYWTYGAFLLMTVAGRFLLRRVTAGGLVLASVATTGIHWLVSDIGGCIAESGLPSLPVYATRLVAALPYEGALLAGTLLYSTILIVTFEWLQRRNPALRAAA
jgi:hypothetical protein